MGVKAAVGHEVGITSVFSFPLDRAVRGAGLSMLARGPVGFSACFAFVATRATLAGYCWPKIDDINSTHASLNRVIDMSCVKCHAQLGKIQDQYTATQAAPVG